MFTIILVAMISGQPQYHFLPFDNSVECQQSIVDRYYIDGEYYQLHQAMCEKNPLTGIY